MNKLLLLTIIVLSCFSAYAQSNMKVDRCADIDRSAPIQNIYIDENNNKWVSDFKGLYLAQSPDHAQIVKVPANEWSILNMVDGNIELKIPMAELSQLMGDAFEDINANAYDRRTETLYVGTTESGVYHFKVKPRLELIKTIDTGNSKLKSDYINTIYIEDSGQIWIGTEAGVLVGSGSKWELLEKNYDITAIAINGGKTYLLGDAATIIELDARNRGYLSELEERAIDGDIKDIDVDSKGRLWVASEIVVRYDETSESYDFFGPAENFTSQFVTKIAVDKDDALWVGTEDKGVYFIGNNLSMTATLVVEKALSCNPNAKDAILQARASGGEPPYRFKWTNQATGQQIENIGPGEYAVTITDSKGKTVSAQTTIEDTRLSVTVVQEQVASAGGSADGKAKVTVKGGTSPYNFKWDSGETTANAQKLTLGNHSLTITDKTGCSTTATVEIGEGLAPLQLALQQTQNIPCNGEKKAALVAQASGGQAPYQYQWSTAASTQEISDLGVGTYSLTITDATGATASADIPIQEPTTITANISVQSPASTNNTDGKATAKATGGSGSYTYQWDTGETAASAVKLGAGKHQVTITDANGCNTTASIDITENILQLVVNIKPTSPIKCFGATDGALEVETNGGKPPFQYQWSTTGLSGEKASGLSAGDYQVTVSDAAGNEQTANIKLEQAEELTATISVQASASTGGKDGKATVKPQGGSGTYSYQWDNGETAKKAEQLAAGTHSVTITDSAGCSTSATVEIGEDILPLAVVINVVAENNCFGAKEAALEVEVNGGKLPFQYQWSTANLSGEKASGLSAGDYQVTVSDAAGNEQTANIKLEQAEELTATISVQASASTGGKDGKATVKAQGGSGTYTYQWDNGETAKKAEQLSAGTHSVTITDNAGCSTSATVEIGEDILPLAVAINVVAENNCFGAKEAALEVEVNGGKPPFQYQWSTANLNGEKASGLSAGDYQVTVSDAAGNEQTANIKLEQAEELTATISVQASASTGGKDGKATVKAQGGSGTYTYQWDNGETAKKAEQLSAGTHSVTITDSAGCNTSAIVEIGEDILPLAVAINVVAENNCFGAKEAALEVEVNGGKPPFQYQWDMAGLSGEKASGLSAGDYQVTVSDAAGNEQTANIKLEQAEELTATISVQASASTGGKDGKATVKAQGGSGTYTYQWDNGETAKKAEQLSAGTHSVSITDNAGCSTSATVEIGEDILPLAVVINVVAENNCFGAKEAALEVEVNGGKPPFQYQWDMAGLSGEKASNIAAGTYQVSVTDAVGTLQSANINVKEPEELTLSIQPQSPASTNNSDGKASAKAQGGSGKYSYRWDNGETAALASKLSAGKHTLTITDDKGCTTTGEIEITENILPLSLAINQTAKINCFAEKNAALEVEVSGGKGPFQYQWNDSALSNDKPNGLGAGNYELTVTDAVGARQTASFSIKEPKALTASASVDASASTNNSDGKASVQAQGGTGNYTYRWDSGETTATATQLSPGNHNVTITDENGCTFTTAVNIDENILPLTVAIDQTVNSACFGDNAGAIGVEVKGGKPPYTYQWDKAELSGNQLNGLAPGQYKLTVSDESGQNKAVAVSVEEPSQLTVELLKTRPATNEDSKDGRAELIVNGGTAPYTYAWDNGETIASATKLTYGTHSVTVTDINACTASLDFETGKKIMPALTAGRLRAGQTLRLEKLYFEADSTKMTETSVPLVNEIYEFLEDNPTIVIEVGGHTNGIPEHDFCDWLSTERAKNVAAYIVDKGVDPNRIVYKGYGKRKPIASNKSADGRRRNQRVEVKILDLGLNK